MESEELQDILKTTPQEIINAIRQTRAEPQWDKIKGQYYTETHDVMNPAKRQDKQVESGDQKITMESVNRIPVPYQKQIVASAAQFLCGNPIVLQTKPPDQLEEVENNLLIIVQKIWKDNKLDYDSKQIAKRMFSECEVAELWYWEAAPENYWAGTPNEKVLGLSEENGQVTTKQAGTRLRMKIISPALGDKLFPVFNAAGDMIAFGREYHIPKEGKEVPHMDLYLPDNIIYMEKPIEIGSEWSRKDVKNVIGKIPVIYYAQLQPEWHDQQQMIDRYEKLISNHADTNDYNGSPMVIVHGKIIGFAKKGEQGKVLELEAGAAAEYLTWESAPESIKMELENLVQQIFDTSSTPMITFDKLSGLGAYSGIALRMLFLQAHMKASDHEETFGKSMQRRINFLKSAAATINHQLIEGLAIDISPKFEYYMPQHTEEQVTVLNAAVAGGIMSVETAVHQNPLVQDAEAEVEKIEGEADKAEERRAAHIIPE